MAKKGGVLDLAFQKLKQDRRIIANTRTRDILPVQLRPGDMVMGAMGESLTVFGIRTVSESDDPNNKTRYYTIIIYDDFTESIPMNQAIPIQKIIK